MSGRILKLVAHRAFQVARSLKSPENPTFFIYFHRNFLIFKVLNIINFSDNRVYLMKNDLKREHFVVPMFLLSYFRQKQNFSLIKDKEQPRSANFTFNHNFPVTFIKKIKFLHVSKTQHLKHECAILLKECT